MKLVNRKAFTLVELLVVIAVIGILVSLLLPAVQAAREAARRIECSNNLKQIGLGLHNYHDTYKQFPAGWIGSVADGEPGWGWAAHLLPFVEQSPLSDQIYGNLPISDPLNQAARETILTNFRCPSDAAPDRYVMLEDESSGAEMFRVARSNYVGVFGTEEIEDNPLNGDGAFFQNSRLRFASFIDGLSSTFVVGERSSKIDGSTWVGAVPEAAEGMARVVGAADHPPNDPAAHFDDFSSYHPTGAHFLLGDGSVRLIGDTIDHDVYRGLATRAGGEPVGAPD